MLEPVMITAAVDTTVPPTITAAPHVTPAHTSASQRQQHGVATTTTTGSEGEGEEGQTQSKRRTHSIYSN
eukprot:1182376-Prorocentrum_minimum.AAC.2